jgi:class 3 adenylate cyclase
MAAPYWLHRRSKHADEYGAADNWTSMTDTSLKRLRSSIAFLAGHSRDQSEDELRFCAEFEEKLNDELIAHVHWLTLLLLPPLTVVFYLAMDMQDQRPTMVAVQAFASVLLAAVIPFRRIRSVIRPAVWGTYLLLLAYHAVLGRIGLDLHTNYVTAGKALTAVLSMGFVGIISAGNKPILKLMFAASAAAASMYTFADLHVLWRTMPSAMFALITTFLFLLHFNQYRAARKDYAIRVRLAPTHVVRNAGIDLDDLERNFVPRSKRCVCICTDWRSYQAMAETMEPALLAKVLGEYYEMCDGVLREFFPSGNYYSDWIADELFVVAYELDDGQAPVAEQALSACIKLIQAKEDFRKRTGLPAGIDFGLSYGDAVVGMMGPRGFRKATALGPTPGRARRYQSAGKVLRAERGDVDRIVFGRDVLMRVRAPFAVEHWPMTAEQAIRNIDDRDAYFIEPQAKAAPPASSPTRPTAA